MFRFTPDDNSQAAHYFSQAINQDGRFARAYAGLSFTRFQDAFLRYDQDTNKAIADACDKLQGQITSGTSSISQRAALAAYQNGLETVTAMKDEFRKRRDIVYALLKEVPGIQVNLPDGAFYFFPTVKDYFGKSVNGNVISNAEDLCLYLLNEAHVSTVTGEAFGNEDCIRISYAAAEEQLVKAVSRIKEALSKIS